MNGNGNGNGNGELSGGDFSMDLGGYSVDFASGEMELNVEGEAQTEASPELGEAFNPEVSAYTAPPESAYGTPTPSPDLPEAFSVPSFNPEPEVETITGTTLAFGRLGELPFAGLTQQGANLVGAVIDILSGLLGLFTGQPAVGIAVGATQTLSQRTTGKTLGATLAGLLKGGSMPAVNVSAQPQGQPLSISALSSKGSPVSEKTGLQAGKSEGSLENVFSVSAPQKTSSYVSTYYGTPSILSARESGGLFIFPTSVSGIEKEGSSLLKKQEPALAGIDTTSLLFLLGMGVVGIALRKGA